MWKDIAGEIRRAVDELADARDRLADDSEPRTEETIRLHCERLEWIGAILNDAASHAMQLQQEG
jgi:hypothetical protein